jgi:hypothetical protein
MSDERVDWTRVRRSEPHRCLTSPPLRGLVEMLPTGQGEPLVWTISLDPWIDADGNPRGSTTCPICGIATLADSRRAATLHPIWSSGLRVGIKVWVHPACFERCQESVEPTPVPW